MDEIEFLDHYEEEGDYFEDEESLDTQDFRFNKKKIDNKNSIIIESDFNLNSPIMPDIINNICDMVNLGREPMHHKNRTMLSYNKIGKILKGKKQLNGIDDSYRAMRYFLMDEDHSKYYRMFLDNWNTEVKSIKEVSDKFLETIKSKPLQFDIKYTVLNSEFLISNLDKFLEVSLLIDIMSDNKRLLIKNYPVDFEFTIIEENLLSFKTKHWKGHLSDKMLYDSKNNILLDRNMLLMIKDLTIGRFNTMLLLSLNIEKRYSDEVCDLFKNILKLGDSYLLQEGNKGFDSITMLEPICVEQMDKLANETRPEILQPKHYSDYIKSKTETSDKRANEFISKLRNIIYSVNNVYDITCLYGSFRLWGHPYIEYEIGLGKLKEQVRMPKPDIDESYCALLASDLMRDMLINYYKRNKRWNVIDNEHNRSIPGTKNLINNSWITMKDRSSLEGRWHLLEIEKIFDTPEDIADSSLFADKTHSLQLKDIINNVKRDKLNPVPTERLLKTYLKEERVNIQEFIQKIDKDGFSKEDLVIGLKAKERELKRYGRFFTLMTWTLRLYFVSSEYLIKKDIIPNYKGLTMADGFIEVMEKMLDRTKGQRGNKYQYITYANHIDYSKWNNHQRDKAVGPVFSVLDKLYGYNTFFRLSHKIFEQCTVYYPERPDYFGKDSQFYWEGQPGGFEGIRQKGWSLVGILCLMRESKIKRNTQVEILAQGDNQVVFSKYVLPVFKNKQDREIELKNIYYNNESLMSYILKASTKIGLIINQDETVQSANFSVYGKIPIFKGNILNLETKAVNRVSGITNDQLPTAANIMSSVNSMALSISQRDSSIRCAVYYQLIFGIMVLNIIKAWNAISLQGLNSVVISKNALARWLYHDKCIGGNTGMALTRFLIRRFPDPVTEALVFYKRMYEESNDKEVKSSMLTMGWPIFRKYNTIALNKLAEDPTCLNIVKSGDIAILVKSQVKKALIGHSSNIKNKLLKNALLSSERQEEYILKFLEGVKPCFPRFISDFKQSSVCGYIDGIVGLVENSSTMKKMFSNEFDRKVKKMSIEWERIQIDKAMNVLYVNQRIWTCSSSHADYLRNSSWNINIFGATIPHPYEYHNTFFENIQKALMTSKDMMTCLVSPKISLNICDHGPNTPYLGSNTKESSGVYQPWEKELSNPLFKNAAQLRKNINWTVDPNSNLAKSIINNLSYVTGIHTDELQTENKKYRTGTAQHRYRTSRQESGGFCNISPNILSWFTVTSDNMNDLSDINYDFMFQASLIYAETVGAHLVQVNPETASFGLGISCKECIRPLQDLKLQSSFIYSPSGISKKFWMNQLIKTEILENVDLYSDYIEKTDDVPNRGSFSIGLHQSIGIMISLSSMNKEYHISDILSMGVLMKIDPKEWIEGFKYGFSIFVGYNLLQHPEFLNGGRCFSMFKNKYYQLARVLAEDKDFCARLRIQNLDDFLSYKSKTLSPSYPASSNELSKKFVAILSDHLSKSYENNMLIKPIVSKDCIIYNDYDNDIFKKILIIGSEVIDKLVDDKHNKGRSRIYNSLKECTFDRISLRAVSNLPEKLLISSSELKTHAENMIKVNKIYKKSVYTDSEIGLSLKVMELHSWNVQNSEKLEKHKTNIMQSVKSFRFATSAHYKLNDILNNLMIKPPRYILVGGDGSGGMSSLCLRKFKNSEVVYTSILEIGAENLKGGNPGPPQAISHLPEPYKSRCANHSYAWTEPGDLSSEICWKNIKSYTMRMKFELIVIDAHPREIEEFEDIYRLLMKFYNDVLSKDGSVIIKGYTWMIESLYKILRTNKEVNIYGVQSEYCRDQTSEFYFIISTSDILFKDPIHVSSVSELNRSLYSLESELNRAQTIKSLNLHELIPVDWREQYIHTLTGLLSTMNLNLSLVEYVVVLVYNKDYNSAFKTVANRCLFDNLSDNLIPSNQYLIKVISFLSGLLQTKAMLEHDIRSLEIASRLNTEPTFITIDAREKGIYIGDSFLNNPKYVMKKIFPSDELIDATVVRCLLHLMNDPLYQIDIRADPVHMVYNSEDFF
ncbi:L protein [Menghai virus]|uniref:Replicase n=1 Tax=Menghai virus TaxID=1919071 RepID=A0A1L2YVG6_9RHAB|nr:L protein [Menghai virus]APF29060.1 L protein [Menghai virus]